MAPKKPTKPKTAIAIAIQKTAIAEYQKAVIMVLWLVLVYKAACNGVGVGVESWVFY